MVDILFRLIPKVTNEIIFVTGLLGIFILFLKRRTVTYFSISVLIILLMITWRVAYQIATTRYASVLIYPFSLFSACFFAGLKERKEKPIKYFFVFTAVGSLALWINKAYNIKQINRNLEIIAEYHNAVNRKGKEWTLITNAKDAGRIRRMEKANNLMITYYSEKGIDDVSSYIMEHRSLSDHILYNILSTNKPPHLVLPNSELSKYKYVLSVYTQKNKKKRANIYSIESKADLITLSQNKPVEPRSGILINGDLEKLDSAEQSFIKFKNHIGDYSLYFDYDESKRTPENAYFHNGAIFTQYLPYYSCLNDKAISGKNSAKIVTEKGAGYLLFYQKFTSGSYQYSVTFSGKKGTTVCVLYDVYQNKKWGVIPLATYTIPSKGIFQIKTSFSVSLKPDEYFIVGARVSGEAYLDNFCLENRNNE